MKVGIIGAGPAGVTAARVIAKGNVGVMLFSAEKALPYYRPRLPELAFSDEHLDNIFMNPREWYADNGIELRMDSKVKAFDNNFEVTLEDNSREKFDALVIATGGGPVLPGFYKESAAKNIFPLWNYSDAVKIKEKLKSSKKIVIVGGGVIGIESALRAENNGLKVVIVEKEQHLMSRNFGIKASELIETQLHGRNIDLLLNHSVASIEENSNNMLAVRIENDTSVTCDFVVLSIGAGFDTSMAVAAGLKTDRQIIVDKRLQTSSPGIFAAGDIAQLYRITPCSAKEALQQGKVAGNNVLAYLNGEKLADYNVQPVPLRLDYKDFEIYSIGEIPGDKENNKDKVKENFFDYNDMKVYRGLIYEGSALAGVQMVGSNKDIRKYQEQFLLAKVWDKIKGAKYGEKA
jgi:NAD(P)H-nitrite reductase large subunit